jgi:hypothetical protein
MTTTITTETEFYDAMRAGQLSDTLCKGFTCNINRANQVVISDANNLQFEDVSWVGPPNPSTSMFGPQLKRGSNISFKGGVFRSLFMGIVHTNVSGLMFNGCEFTLRSDGIHGVSNDVLITGCWFHDFYKVGTVAGGGDHSDAIQFDNHASTESAHDIIITENIFDQGSGTMFQSIFLKDEVGTLPYRNVTISGNHLIGGHQNQIWVQRGDDVRVISNYVRGYENQAPTYIWVKGTNLDVRHNTAPAYSLSQVAMPLDSTNRVIPVGSA